jgi:hypothetical protein
VLTEKKGKDTYNNTSGTLIRVWCSVRKKQKFCGKRNGTNLQRLELCGITVYIQKETVGLCGVDVSDFTECQQRE